MDNYEEVDENEEAVDRKPTKIFAESPDEHENKMISLAMREVEDRIRKHQATSQELTHFLRLGTTTARLEKEKLSREIELLKAKREVLEAQKKYEDLIGNALEAMRKYSGVDEEEYEYVED